MSKDRGIQGEKQRGEENIKDRTRTTFQTADILEIPGDSVVTAQNTIL